MKDWVDIDLDRELARIERENAREEAIEKRAGIIDWKTGKVPKRPDTLQQDL